MGIQLVYVLCSPVIAVNNCLEIIQKKVCVRLYQDWEVYGVDSITIEFLLPTCFLR